MMCGNLQRVLHCLGGFRDGALAALIQDLNADGEGRNFQIRSANAVWVQQAYGLVDGYRATLRDVFAVSDDRQVDFTGRPTEAAQIINAWVSARTGGKIAGSFRSATVAAPTKLVLSSAIYFRGNWTEGFVRPVTKGELFHVTRTRSVTVPMMHMRRKGSTASPPICS